MSLPNEPIVKKFFSNKIESSRNDWYGYLIQIARIFYAFDNQEYNRDALLERFQEISGRDRNLAQRDASNFRDEFGAYGTYLGIFHLENEGGIWKIVVSEAAKQFLCVENPNAAAFCRTQLAMFQYPNGAGSTVMNSGGVLVQANSKADTQREIENNIHLNPMRTICKIVVALVELSGIAISDVSIPYDILFCMFNDTRINTGFNVSLSVVKSAFEEYSNPQNITMNMSGLTNFKRNFHILEKTGLFVRDSRFGLMVSQVNAHAAYDCIKVISEMQEYFAAYDDIYNCYDDETVKSIIASSAWGRYYDAGTLPIETLEALGVELDRAPLKMRSFTYTESIDKESIRLLNGNNTLLYGVPGSGKSWTIEHEYCHVGSVVERLVFHPDYTNADFIGQILPVVDSEKQVTYEFTSGPFTTILRDAYMHPTREYILIIEEVNRGNAPAIFGEVFQLLDRTVEPKAVDGIIYPTGTSEYGITHKYMAEKIYGDPTHKVRIPSNLSIVGTMNTSDQNVFTLDTAFQRRWRMRLIENNFDNVRASLANAQILDTEVTWKTFCEKINSIIVGNKAKMASAEDKRLGVYFVHEGDITFDQRAVPLEGYTSLLTEYNDLLRTEATGDMPEDKKKRLANIREALMHNRMFPEKVIKYLWDDAFKFNPEALFDTDNMESLEQVIRTFVYSRGRERFKIFKPTVRASLYPDTQA